MAARLRVLSLAAVFVVGMMDAALAVSLKLPSPVALRPETVGLLRALSEEDADQWKLVAFGFTRCTDVCPKTIGTLMQLLQVAGKMEISLDAVFVTVDPDRDSDSVLDDFAAPLGRRVSFLRLEGEELDRFKDEFGVEAVFYTKNAGNEVHYQVDHSSMAFLIDPAGRIRVLFDALEDVGTVAEMFREDRSFFQ